MQECQDEIFYFEKMEVNDFRNDVLLAEACRTDVDKHCKNVQPGELHLHSGSGISNCLPLNPKSKPQAP